MAMYRTGMLQECWAFRGFILASVKRDFVSRYLGSQLGSFWAVLQPFAMIAIYTLVFASIMKPALPAYDWPFAYSIYLCAGIITWQLFSDLITRSLGMFVRNGGLLKKVNVPKLALPIVVAFAGLAQFGVVLGLFVAFLLTIGHFPVAAVLAMVPLAALVVGLALGLGVFLGTLNVFYRDVEQGTSMALQFWFWLTPIVYPARALPGGLADVLAWNPMTPIVSFAQSAFLDGHIPPWSTLLYPTLVAIACLAVGWAAFRKLSGEIVDEL